MPVVDHCQRTLIQIQISGRFAPGRFAPLNRYYIIIDEVFFDNFLVIIYLLVVYKKNNNIKIKSKGIWSTGMLDTSAPGQFGTRTLRHMCKTFRHPCETFRHQDSSAPGQFGTYVFFFDFTYKTSNSLDSDVLISFF
jgi:hypothetical protein